MIIPLGIAAAGRFCWLDLAATDAKRAKDFYKRVFGWTSRAQQANGGTFSRLQLSGEDVGSVYQLKDAHLDHGVPSHWTPYIRVDDVNKTARQVAASGGQVIIDPFVMSGVARIALILDSVGALVGLWEPLRANSKENTHE